MKVTHVFSITGKLRIWLRWDDSASPGDHSFQLELPTGFGAMTTAQVAQVFSSAGEMLQALREAEAGLEVAGADKLQPIGDFVPLPLQALGTVRTAIAKATGGAA